LCLPRSALPQRYGRGHAWRVWCGPASAAVGMTSIERTAYPRFRRLITARELHGLFTPKEQERAWEATDWDEHQITLPARKSYQRMGCFPKQQDMPEQAVEFVRRVTACRRAHCR